jgi:hypothetical protein
MCCSRLWTVSSGTTSSVAICLGEAAVAIRSSTSHSRELSGLSVGRIPTSLEHAVSLDQGHGEGAGDRGLAPHHTANDARKRLGRDHPTDVPAGARQDRAQATPPIEPCGEDHELRSRALGGQPRQACDAADPRQLVVNQHDVGALLPRQLQRRRPVGHGNDADTGPAQHVQKRIPDVCVRTRDQHPHRRSHP